jgi:hypothetical protein
MRQDHPFRLIGRLRERLDQLKPLGKLLRLKLRGRLGDLNADIGRHLLQIESLQHLADCFRADHRGEAVSAELILSPDVFFFGQELAILERRETRLENHVVFKVQDALEILERHVEQQTDAARQ